MVVMVTNGAGALCRVAGSIEAVVAVAVGYGARL